MGPGGALTATALTRRAFAAGAALAAAGCRDAPPAPPPLAWVGADAARGHRLRRGDPLPQAAVQRRAQVVVVGAGIAGLAAARGFMRRGVADVQVLELEDAPGGNSRGHVLAGMRCPLGAHYLPVPDRAANELHELAEWLHAIGLLRDHVPDERHLAHSPQERVFFEGAWHEGLLPAEPGSAAALQAQRFAAELAQLQRSAASAGRPAFALPAHRSAWGAEQESLNRVTFARWLDQRGFVDPLLRGWLDYCCRDDFGAGADAVSAWAGAHYFASRHGADGDRGAVFTWPEGNAWLVQRLAAPLADRVQTARALLRVAEQRHGVELLAWDEARGHVEQWTAQRVVLALPLFVAARVLESPPQALRDAATLLPRAPWLVANLQLHEPLLARPGAPPAWDNVIHGSRGLGYVDAMHQSLRTHEGPTVITAYHALPATERGALLADDPKPWAERVLADLEVAHPDIRRRVARIHLARWGHAMAVPAPGVQRHPALAALRAMHGRVCFAHADLAGYSVFEEAFCAGCEAAAA